MYGKELAARLETLRCLCNEAEIDFHNARKPLAGMPATDGETERDRWHKLVMERNRVAATLAVVRAAGGR